MSLAWGSRLSGSSLAWGTREASTTAGVINGTAAASEFVERDLTLTWQLQAGVTSDLSLLWQLEYSPVTAVESDLNLTWQLVVTAGTTVEADLNLLWQVAGSVTSNLYMEWNVALEAVVSSISTTVERNSVVFISTRPDSRVRASQYKMLARAA